MRDLRAAGAYDIPGVYRVCLLADDPLWPGGVADRNPDLIGHVFAGPYLAGVGTLARVAVDPDGVAGYVLGCTDTAAFEQWCEQDWWPALRRQYPIGSGVAVDAWLIERIHDPVGSPRELLDDYPAHLHIDLLPRARGTGVGRDLMEWLMGALREQEVRGVHLGVGSDNTHAIGFYEHLGFGTASDDGDTRWMVRSLT